MLFDLPSISLYLTIFALMVYVIRDGAELGLGVLYPSFYNRVDVREVLTTPWWKKEIWLLLALIGWMIVFPGIFEVVFTAFTIPLAILVPTQIIRFFAQAKLKINPASTWGWVFFVSAILIAFIEGLMLGEAIHGFEVIAPPLTAKSMGWVTPLSGFCALTLIVSYSLLGMSWYIYISKDELEPWVFNKAIILTFTFLGAILIVSAWLPLAETRITMRWFSWPQILYLSPIPLLTVWAGFLLWLSLVEQRRQSPYALSVSLVVLCVFGVAISLWPYVVPWQYTIWEVANEAPYPLVGFLFLVVTIAGAGIYEFRRAREKSVLTSQQPET